MGANNQKKSVEEFIRKAREIYGNIYTYPSDQVYNNCSTKLQIICLKEGHGLFLKSWLHHIYRKQGCPKCSREEFGCRRRTHSYSEFVERGTQIHHGVYTYPKYQVYKSVNDPLIINCPHGEYITTFKQHITNKRGCKCGSNRATAQKRSHGIEKFIEKSKSIFGNKYSFDKNQIYLNNRSKIEGFCNVHKRNFTTNYRLHLENFQGCQFCRWEKEPISKGAFSVFNFLKTKLSEEDFSKISLEFKIPGTRYFFDFYIPSHNMLIEYNGEQHFRPVSKFGGVDQFLTVSKRDFKKRVLAWNENFTLVMIEKHQLNDLERVFSKYF